MTYRRPVRYVDHGTIAVDIALALPEPGQAERFPSTDLATAIDQLATPGFAERLEAGPWPGRRLIIEPGQTVDAFSVFVDIDPDNTVLVYAVDNRPAGFPHNPDN